MVRNFALKLKTLWTSYNIFLLLKVSIKSYTVFAIARGTELCAEIKDAMENMQQSPAL